MRVSSADPTKSIHSGRDITSHRPGAYVFRHTIATHMVQRGTTFKEIADILGHRSLESTTIYAKLDLRSLAQVAIAWPGGVA